MCLNFYPFISHFFILLSLPFLSTAQNMDSLAALTYIDSLNETSLQYAKPETLEKALELNHKAKTFASERFGKVSLAYGDCCHYLGLIKYNLEDYKEAEYSFLEAKSILSKRTPMYQTVFLNCNKYLVIIYVNTGEYTKAQSLITESLSVLDSSNQINTSAHVFYYYYQAILESIRGQYTEAEDNYQKALQITEQNEGKATYMYAAILKDIGLLFYEASHYEKAETHLLESKNIREKILGKDDIEYGEILNNLGIVYYAQGRYEKAEEYLLQSKNIYEINSGRASTYLGNCLNNLGLLYGDMGQHLKAENKLIEAKEIREKLYGKEHPYYAQSLNNLANLYRKIKNYAQSETLQLEAKTIKEKIFGKNHADYIGSIINLANLYQDIGKMEKVEPLLLEAKHIFEVELKNTTHLYYRNALNGLFRLYHSQGQYQKAIDYMMKVDSFDSAYLGKDHPDYAYTIYNQAALYLDMKQYHKASEYLLQLATSSKRLVNSALQHLSENEMQNYIEQHEQFQNLILRLLKISGLHNITAEAYDNCLFYKGFLLQAHHRIKNLAKRDSVLFEKFEKLKVNQRNLSKIYAAPIASRNMTTKQQLETHIEQLEKDLNKSMAGYQIEKQQVSWKQIRAKLRNDEACIEFVSYKLQQVNDHKTYKYAALLLRSQDSFPVFIDLFDEGELALLLSHQDELKFEFVNNLYTIAHRGAIETSSNKKSLYELVWKPIESYLQGITKVYFSPTKLLHRINLDAVPVSVPNGNETETLADRYHLIELNSTRQLVIPTQIIYAHNDAVLYGGIQFEQDSALNIGEPLVASRSRGNLPFIPMDSTLRGGSWNYLAGTEREATTIEKILKTSGVQTTIKKGHEATEESVKNIGINNTPSPRILHIATHGYFFSDPKEKVSSSQLTVSSQEPVFKISDNPMLRSGLIMAGGNAAWQGKQTLEGREDGILTALEISQMNLSNTELVVLSACETGLGDIQGNEGVYGLQRAFKIAGVKYIIMSLWQVPDKQTSLLMTTFYKKWLEAEDPNKGGSKMTIPDAFHAAQKELRDIGLDPYQWAGFVLVE